MEDKKIYVRRTWEPSENTGYDSLDHHHKKFVDVINNLVDILNENKYGSTEVLDIFHKLLYYAETYFIDEELLYQKNNYAELKKHQEQHTEFIAEISKFRHEFKKGTSDVCIRMMKYLDIWYKNHILGSDSNAAKSFKKI